LGLCPKHMGKQLVKSDNHSLQNNFLEKFFSGRFAKDFYLTGGTALGRFLLKHRESIDLDLFTNNQNIDFSDLNFAILKILEDLRLKVSKQVATKTFLQYICEGRGGLSLKIDVVKDIPVHFGKIITKGNIRLDSLENIGSNKILAVFGRSDAKDFIDLYFMLTKTRLKFDYLYGLAKQKDLGLSEFYLANSIRQIEEITVYPQMLKQFNKIQMLKFYKDLSKKLLAKIKPKE